MFYSGYICNSPELCISFLLLCNHLPQTRQPKPPPIYLLLSVGQNSECGIDGFSALRLVSWLESRYWLQRTSHLELTSHPKLIQVARRIEFLMPVVMWPSAFRDLPSPQEVHNRAICFLPQEQQEIVFYCTFFFEKSIPDQVRSS